MAEPAFPSENAQELFVEVPSAVAEGPKIQLFIRVWGNRDSGIPVLFVHGGPGNDISSYRGINQDFFDYNKFYVVEVDQRGTGKSQPSVADLTNGVKNMKLYLDISMPQMSNDFEIVRKELAIEKWLVFGGSWGSTLALDYATRFPDCCLGLIVRGIFLGTKPEHDAVYARKAFADQESDVKKFQLKQFDAFFDYACKEVERRRSVEGSEEAPLDPDDCERICRVYESLVLEGDRKAAWMVYAYEENLMAEEESELLSYDEIDEASFGLVQTTAFFEMRLFTRLTFEEPPELVARLGALTAVKTWVVQGTGDAVCPDNFARDLVAGLQRAEVPHKAYFVQAGHKSSSPNIKKTLQRSVAEFAENLAAVSG